MAAKEVLDAAYRSYTHNLKNHDISHEDLLVDDEEGFPAATLSCTVMSK